MMNKQRAMRGFSFHSTSKICVCLKRVYIRTSFGMWCTLFCFHNHHSSPCGIVSNKECSCPFSRGCGPLVVVADLLAIMVLFWKTKAFHFQQSLYGGILLYELPYVLEFIIHVCNVFFINSSVHMWRLRRYSRQDKGITWLGSFIVELAV